MNRIEPERIMALLEKVGDPEIPVISIIDLGIVRDVFWDGEQCVVAITPTYSGCPAMREIEADIRTLLAGYGIDEVRIETRLAPPWTTDWMSEKGRAALKGYGIAPPGQKAVDISGLIRAADAPVVDCPLCGSPDTRLVSHFGSTSCKALYRCRQCGEPFDYFKAH
jgi:ring-1,2-phenylacetyl-CoA epoxidase subunit PaaD